MTTKQILKTLRSHGKKISLTHLYRLFRIIQISPAGKARPQLYPRDTLEKLFAHLGLSPAMPAATAPAPARRSAPGGKLISAAQLRAAKNTKGTK